MNLATTAPENLRQKNQKKYCIYFPVLIQAGKSRINFGAERSLKKIKKSIAFIFQS
jgi:hypothetical protein